MSSRVNRVQGRRNTISFATTFDMFGRHWLVRPCSGLPRFLGCCVRIGRPFRAICERIRSCTDVEDDACPPYAQRRHSCEQATHGSRTDDRRAVALLRTPDSRLWACPVGPAARATRQIEPAIRGLAQANCVTREETTGDKLPTLHLPNSAQVLALSLCLLSTCLVSAAEPAGQTTGGCLEAGTGIVDITPAEPVVLAGSPSPQKSRGIQSRLFVKALVLSSGGVKVAIVTLDTLKYPVEHVVRARQHVEKTSGIPASNVLICASHTHSAPLWSYYDDQLVTPISQAVAVAVRDLTPCRVGTASGKVEGVSECRRVIKDGRAWNRWQLPPDEATKYAAESQADTEFDLLALMDKDGKCKSILYDFACHAANNRETSISADYPGDVQEYVKRKLGSEVPTLFLPGACGDVNPVYSVPMPVFGEKLGACIVDCLERLEFIAQSSLSIESREIAMAGREQPVFKEAEISRNWPAQLEHYRKAFDEMKQLAKPSYPFFLSGLRIGDDFAIVTNPDELFCEIGQSIKRQSPIKHTMVVEQTNGAHGYIPTAKAFSRGSYETWFGEHSYLTTKAATIIESESLDILKRLKRVP